MDGHRFDDVARFFGSGASRRSVLKGIALGLIGLGSPAIAGRSAAAQQCVLTGDPCVSDDSECCGDGSGVVCAGVPRMCVTTLSCVGGTGPCNPDKGVNCCEGLVCNITDGSNGDCEPPPPTCTESGLECGTNGDCCDGLSCATDNTCKPTPTCTTIGSTCDPDVACCGGLSCGTDNTCQPTPTCAAENDDCQSDSDCCQGICCGGTCRDIACCEADEDPDARCGKNEQCYQGACNIVCTSDIDCAAGSCCCSDGGCSGDCCAATGGETSDGGASSGEASGGESSSVPSAFPNTGSGETDGSKSGRDGLLGAGIVAAGAALLAGRKLRSGQEE